MNIASPTKRLRRTSLPFGPVHSRAATTTTAYSLECLWRIFANKCELIAECLKEQNNCGRSPTPYGVGIFNVYSGSSIESKMNELTG